MRRRNSLRLDAGSRLRAANWGGFVFHCCFAAWVASADSVLALQLLPIVVYDVAMGVVFLGRRAPRTSVSSAPARAIAYARALLLPVVFAIISRTHPEWMAPTGNRDVLVASGLLLLGGLAVSGWALGYLRRNFSIEAQARQLTTGGPYGLVRHPIYTGYVLQYAGFLLARPTPVVVIAVAVWAVLVRRSIRYEEQALVAAFPEYVAYRQRVGAVFPRLRRSAARVDAPLRSA